MVFSCTSRAKKVERTRKWNVGVRQKRRGKPGTENIEFENGSVSASARKKEAVSSRKQFIFLQRTFLLTILLLTDRNRMNAVHDIERGYVLNLPFRMGMGF